jgi:hypothetical protein
MPKSMSVQFEDGTSHTYDNVPDEVTQDQVNERAKQDYPDRNIAEIAEGAHPDAPQPEASEPEPSTATQAGAVGQQMLEGANQFLSSPLGHLVSTGAIVGYGGSKLNRAAKTFSNGSVPKAPVAPGATAPSAPVAPQAPTSVNPTAEMNAHSQIANALHPDEFAEYTRSGNLPQRLGGTAPNAMRGVTSIAPTSQSVPLPPTSPQAAPTYQNFLSRVAQDAKRYAPAVAETAGQVGRFAAKALTPAMIAKELFYTSPEEIATLKAAEAKRRAAGWKPLNER